MVNLILRHSGGGSSRHPSQDVAGEGYPPLAGYISLSACSKAAVLGVDHPVGNSVGAIGWWIGSCRSDAPAEGLLRVISVPAISVQLCPAKGLRACS